MKVLIVGTGIVGLAIAEELTRRGAEVELFERNDQVGQEASWAAAGILSPQGEAQEEGPLLSLLRLGYPLIPELVTRLEAKTQMDVRYRAQGMLTLALTEADERQLEEEILWQRKAGISLEQIAASQVKSLEPAVDGPVRWGIWNPQAASVDCRRLVEAYRRAVERQGALIRKGTKADHFLLEGDRVAGIETPRGKVKADWVVNCAGSWAGFDEKLSFPVPTIPVKGQILQFRTARSLFSRIIKSPRAYLVQRFPQELIAGTTVEYASYDKRLTQEGRCVIQAGAGEIASCAASLSLETAWAGLRPGTPDRLPILGPSPFKNLLLATGHFRSGIILAPLTGRLIADWIIRGSCSVDLSPFSVSRFLAKAVHNN